MKTFPLCPLCRHVPVDPVKFGMFMACRGCAADWARIEDEAGRLDDLEQQEG